MPEVSVVIEEGFLVCQYIWNDEKSYCQAGEFVSGRIYDYEYEIILN